MPKPTKSSTTKSAGRNSDKKKKAASHNIRIVLSGSGYRASLYSINDEILEALRNTPVEEAQYEDNPFSNVGNIALSSCLVCLGLDINNDQLAAKMFVDNLEVNIVKIGFIPEECNVEDELGVPPQDSLVAFSDDVEMLSDYADVALEPTDDPLYILEVEEYKHGVLSVALESAVAPSPGDLRLGLIDVDDPASHITQITYANRLLGNVEQEIRFLIADKKKYEFELEIYKGYSSSFYLIRDDGSQPELLDPSYCGAGG